MEVRIATFNIFWFASSTFIGNQRSPADLSKLQEVIKRLDADIIVFEEILDLPILEDLVTGVPDRSYSLRDQGDRWISSSTGSGLKVALAFDSDKLQLIEAGTARNPGEAPASHGKRDAIAVRVRPRDGGSPLTVIGVHLKSGTLTVGEPVTADDFTRVAEMEKLTRWILNLAPIAPNGQARQAGEPTVLIGDFNAVRGNAALTSLSPGGALAQWSWPDPGFATAVSPDVVPVNLPPAERWTTHVDMKIIDHIIMSPQVRVIDGPWAYAFDRDNSWLQAAGVTQAWFEQLGCTFNPAVGHPSQVANLHRVSDHRPVLVSVDLT